MSLTLDSYLFQYYVPRTSQRKTSFVSAFFSLACLNHGCHRGSVRADKGDSVYCPEFSFCHMQNLYVYGLAARSCCDCALGFAHVKVKS